MKLSDLYIINSAWGCETIFTIINSDHKLIYQGVKLNMPRRLFNSVVDWFDGDTVELKEVN